MTDIPTPPPPTPAELDAARAAQPPEPTAPSPAPTVGETLYGKPPEPAPEPAPAAPAEPVPPTPELNADGTPKTPAPAEPAADPYSTLTVPDTISIVPETLTKFKTLAAELNVPPEAAQRLTEFYAKVAQEQSTAQLAAQQTVRDAWTTEILAMPEFQGDAKRQSEAILRVAVDEFGSPEVGQYFAANGDHPAVVKMILSMARALVEDSPTPAGQPVGSARSAPKTPGQIMYDS